jgi:hypothetical protein
MGRSFASTPGNPTQPPDPRDATGRSGATAASWVMEGAAGSRLRRHPLPITWLLPRCLRGRQQPRVRRRDGVSRIDRSSTRSPFPAASESGSSCPIGDLAVALLPGAPGGAGCGKPPAQVQSIVRRGILAGRHESDRSSYWTGLWMRRATSLQPRTCNRPPRDPVPPRTRRRTCLEQ